MPDCVFCSIVAGTEPHLSVDEDAQTLSFMSAAPATSGHVIVVPKRHAADIWDITDEDACAVMAAAVRVARRIESILSPAGLNLVQATRPAGFQHVLHFHLHVIPRYVGDNLKPPWPLDQPRGDQAEMSRIAELLRE